MTRNYHRKLIASIYQHAKNVGIIGILAYPKNVQRFNQRESRNAKMLQAKTKNTLFSTEMKIDTNFNLYRLNAKKVSAL